MIPWLEAPDFPPLTRALAEPNGLLAAGGQLTPAWLLAAYRRGIFPWFSEGEPIMWWSPDPRMVLLPSQVRITRSLAKTLRSDRFEVRFDTVFAQVMAGCAAPRADGHGTWITAHMQAAYLRLHELGYAHSVECFIDNELVGGLYGIALDKAFFGESMFSRVSDASKVALAHLARFLDQRGVGLIDCQMTTSHLSNMGGVEIPRAAFSQALSQLIGPAPEPQHWPKQSETGQTWTRTPE
ncbi:leucyl/phenylalanyl-tRNA--protein transferase [Denitromonas ohlonensis]|uniref:Leucyl/phenylalanyl-tRNA--protein transferase n=2 Tax=Denitromonas TaxID=139331 RepID=A0A558CNB6_9RHOO|nr:leucyl/phenylalanyl-tRNA--protein transferase [Denitromonas ohlonensis]TVO69235.1 leucyl/phenylalanyl-tRNA--protein transferase [Denitromonas ohlonensis]TVO77335.1 leucyl/phenylalanyl-tRNA--protein transferase [Denitromonas ohlonensis]TVT50266.1 MAG: leucyl/phenylalanyl-tRNA--protein transferase [Denitromonas halophila]TVT74937.1 MAG: leucyl/phenylalanyl-tRNA--protein transferase [Denitromonas halophila]